MTSDKEYNDVNQNILEIFGTMNAPTSTISYLHDEFNYTDEHHARYERDGYLFCNSFLSADGLARCRKEFDRMIDILQPGAIGPEHALAPPVGAMDIRLGQRAGIWSPFDKIDHDNAAMSVVPGWHKNG